MSKPKSAKITWEEGRQLYETALRAARKSPGTLRGYFQEIANFERKAVSSPADVTTQDLREHVCGLLTGSTSASGRANGAANAAKIATVLAGFFKFLHEEGRSPRTLLSASSGRASRRSSRATSSS